MNMKGHLRVAFFVGACRSLWGGIRYGNVLIGLFLPSVMPVQRKSHRPERAVALPDQLSERV